jgi:hypothetical protein
MSIDKDGAIQRTLRDIIQEALGGPCGDPDESHMECARLALELIHHLGLDSGRSADEEHYIYQGYDNG